MDGFRKRRRKKRSACLAAAPFNSHTQIFNSSNRSKIDFAVLSADLAWNVS